MLESLRDSICRAMQTEDVPGIAMALLVMGEIADVVGFGVRCHGQPEPVTADTIFPAASVTKPVVAYAVLKLVERGALDLDAPLDSYLAQPYLPTGAQAVPITTRHILSHQSGFPNWREEGQPLRLKWLPGAQFNYSGEGFLYLQKVIETITGQRLDVHLQEHVFGPLKMRSSTLIWQPFIEERAAWGYGDNRNWAMGKEELPVSAYSLYTTAEDMARFLQAILADESEKSSGAYLTSSSIRQMLTPQVKVGDWPDLSWGLGWGIQQTAMGDLFWHWGANPGFKHYVAGSREHRVGIVMLTNYEDGLPTCRQILPLLGDPCLSIHHPAFDWLLPNEQWREDGRTI